MYQIIQGLNLWPIEPHSIALPTELMIRDRRLGKVEPSDCTLLPFEKHAMRLPFADLSDPRYLWTLKRRSLHPKPTYPKTCFAILFSALGFWQTIMPITGNYSYCVSTHQPTSVLGQHLSSHPFRHWFQMIFSTLTWIVLRRAQRKAFYTSLYPCYQVYP